MQIKQCAAEVETLQTEKTAAERRCTALDADIVTSPTRIRNEIKGLTKHKEEVRIRREVAKCAPLTCFCRSSAKSTRQ